MKNPNEHPPIDAAMLAYVYSVSLREPDVIKRLRDETDSLPDAGMQSASEQGALLALLVEMLNVKKAFEIGVFTGYSALVTALAMPDDGRLIACDVNEAFTSIGKKYWQEAGVAHKIDLRLRPALETLDELLAEGQAGTFDFAFIDADKSNYGDYYERALQLVRPGGLIVVDNTLWYGKPMDLSVQDADTVAIRTLNQKLHHDERVSLAMLPIADGMTLALKR
ncbi:MAG: SAM-dependent methyltransferase [Acidobacteria bacterium]|nr:SAM-dependent methyltransferase [Acidobacteriota bacterium]